MNKMIIKLRLRLRKISILKTISVFLLIGTILPYLMLVCMQIYNEVSYDYTKTALKVIGGYGTGSGNIIFSSQSGSIALTNAHVCVGTTNPQIYKQVATLEGFCGFFPPPLDNLCYYSSNLNKQKLYEGLIGDEISIQFNNLPIGLTTSYILHISHEYDLCLVRVPVGNIPNIRISNDNPEMLERVQVLGNPLGVTNHLTEGFIGDEIRHLGNDYVLMTAPIYSGNSGSAVVNMDGELVGVVTLGAPEPTINFMIPLRDIKTYLSTVRDTIYNTLK